MKRIRPTIVLLIVVTLLVSCATATVPATPTEVPATATPSPTATTPAATPTARPSAAVTATPKPVAPTGNTGQPATGSKIDGPPAGILTKTAAARGLQAKGEVPFTTISKDGLRPYLVKKFEKERGKEELEKSKALLVMFDLIGEKDDLYALYLGLLDEQVLGFYEFENRSMTLVGGGGAFSAKDEIVLAHEYVHALQDQHFNIGARVRQARNDGEKSLALQALIEGDATLAMADYASKNMRHQDLASLQNDAGSLNMQKLRSAPLVLQVSLLFPYQQGANFVASLFRSGGWAAVNTRSFWLLATGFFVCGFTGSGTISTHLVAKIFGSLSVGVIFGLIFTIHQIGGAIGSYSAGLVFDLTGTYFNSFVMAAALCFIASGASFSIREQPLKTQARAVAGR